MPFIILSFFSHISVQAQVYDYFMQGQSVPQIFNPAFSGSLQNSRFTYSQIFTPKFKRSLYPLISQDTSLSTNFYIGYDQYVKPLKSGIGFSVLYGNFNPLNQNKISITSSIAPKINLNNSYTLSVAASFTYNNIASNELDNIDNTNLTYKNYFNNIFYSSCGWLLNSKKFYIGYSVMNFGRIDITPKKHSDFELVKRTLAVSTDSVEYLNNVNNLQAGVNLKVNDNVLFSLSFILQFNKSINNVRSGQFNINTKYKKVILGSGFGYVPSFFGYGSIGYQSNNFKILYSYGINNFVGMLDPNEYKITIHEVVFTYVNVKTSHSNK